MSNLLAMIRHRFVRNVLTLQAGSFAGNLIQGFAGIAIARLLQPALFGEYTLAFGVAGIAAVLVGAGIQDAVSSIIGAAHARADKELTLDISAFMIKLTAIAAAITLCALPFLPRVASALYHDSTIGGYAAIIVLGVILSSLFFAFASLTLQAGGNIRMLTVLIVFDQLIRYGLSVLFVWQGWGVAGAVTGHLLGAVLVSILAVSFFHNVVARDDIIPHFSAIFRRLRSVSLVRYLGFTFNVAVDRNISNLYLVLPVAITGAFVSKTDTGFFKLSFGYINLALSLLGPISVLLNMEFPRIHAESKEKLVKNFKRVSLYSIGISAVLTAGALLAARLAFLILYGRTFVPAVTYVYGLAVYGALFGIGVGLGPMWRAINKVNISILINCVVLGLGIPLGIFLVRQWDVWGAVGMVTIWFTVSHFASFIYLARKLKEI
ncbi:MAG TPA: oligosaccharide flippase family protein [Candidatus Paceibacterota bacterium]|nr:oligosaccharide flippase family protein [Candidatus Paceibacterota bacterium]